MVWILFYFHHIWVFALRAPSSSEVPVVLINQPSDSSEWNPCIFRFPGDHLDLIVRSKWKYIH